MLAVLLASIVTFFVVLEKTRMLAGKYLLVVGILLLALFAIVTALILAFGKKHLPWAGIAVALVLTAGMIFGSVAGIRGINTLKAITSPAAPASHIGVYVRSDDTAQTLNDLSDRTFGLLSLMGRERVDGSVANIEDQLSVTIRTLEFSNTAQLLDALFNGSVGAMVMDTSYLEGLEQVEEYADVRSRVREITNMNVAGGADPTPAPADQANKHVYTIYISGIDSRHGFVRSSLSDVNIAVVVNLQTHQALMISTPRDYYVPIGHEGIQDKLTHAGWYGLDVAMETVGNIYDIDFDYYFRVNFEGFKEIIDALGGITVKSKYDFTSNIGNYHFVEGENTLDGERALAFVRERKAFADGDRQRGENQMLVIRAIINKVMSPELLVRYSSLLQAAQGNFATSVPYSLIASTIRDQLDDVSDWNIVSYSVNGTDSHNNSPVLGENVYVMEPDWETVEVAKQLIAQMRNDEIITDPDTAAGGQ